MTSKTMLRLGLYLILVLFALFYLMPLFVMLTTSLKSLGGDPHRQPAALPRRDHLRPLGRGLVVRLRRHPV